MVRLLSAPIRKPDIRPGNSTDLLRDGRSIGTPDDQRTNPRADRTDDPIEPLEAGQYIAARIPNARFVELAGRDHHAW